MKRIINHIRLFIGIPGIFILLFSCKKQNIYRDAAYPDQVIYMPAAVNGVFLINSVPQRIGNVPTTGMAYRFTVDIPNKKFIVPLGVFRGGVNTNGGAHVAIAANTDTVGKMIALGKFTGSSAGTELLPAGKFLMPSSVDLADGAELATFDLKIDLDFLKANPGKIYAIGVTIASEQIKANPLLNTAVVVVDTKLLTPAAAFTTSVDAANKKVTFTNTSAYAESYSWDFGDGTTASVDKSPSHVYAAAGTYTVTLTIKGVAGDVSTVNKVVTL